MSADNVTKTMSDAAFSGPWLSLISVIDEEDVKGFQRLLGIIFIDAGGFAYWSLTT